MNNMCSTPWIPSLLLLVCATYTQHAHSQNAGHQFGLLLGCSIIYLFPLDLKKLLFSPIPSFVWWVSPLLWQWSCTIAAVQSPTPDCLKGHPGSSFMLLLSWEGQSLTRGKRYNDYLKVIKIDNVFTATTTPQESTWVTLPSGPPAPSCHHWNCVCVPSINSKGQSHLYWWITWTVCIADILSVVSLWWNVNLWL